MEIFPNYDYDLVIVWETCIQLLFRILLVLAVIKCAQKFADYATDLLYHNVYKLCYNCVRIEHKGVYNDCNDNSKS